MSQENMEIARGWIATWNGVDQVAVIEAGKAGEPVPAFVDERHRHPEFEYETHGGADVLGFQKGLTGWVEWVMSWAHLRHEYGEPVDCGDKVFIPVRQYMRTKRGDVEMESQSGIVMNFRNGKLKRFDAYTREDAARKAAGLPE